jgi:hypothetical protein
LLTIELVLRQLKRHDPCPEKFNGCESEAPNPKPTDARQIIVISPQAVSEK